MSEHNLYKAPRQNKDRMREYTTIGKIFGGGKVTVPKAIREAMRLRDGDLVEITIRIVEDESEGKQGNFERPATAWKTFWTWWIQMSTDTLGLHEYEAIEPSTTFERLVMARLEALEAENRELRTLVEDLQNTTGRERAYDRQRISKLETGHLPGKKTFDQIDKIKTYILTCPNYTAPFEAIQHHLNVKGPRFSKIISASDDFEILKNPHDKRKKLLRLKAKN